MIPRIAAKCCWNLLCLHPVLQQMPCMTVDIFSDETFHLILLEREKMSNTYISSIMRYDTFLLIFSVGCDSLLNGNWIAVHPNIMWLNTFLFRIVGRSLYLWQGRAFQTEWNNIYVFLKHDFMTVAPEYNSALVLQNT